MAKLYFRYGAMNSSKTANALMVKHNYEEMGKRVVLLKPSIDNRDGETMVGSRMGLKAEAIPVSPNLNLLELIDWYRGSAYDNMHIDAVIIDEVQFLTKEQVRELATIVDTLNIPVLCYGLRSDFRGELFEGAAALMALADSIEEIKTICWCGRKAIMNARVVDGKVIYDGEQVVIGGSELYQPLCRKHWRKGQIKEEAE